MNVSNGGRDASAHEHRRYRVLLADDHLDVVRELHGLLAPEFDVVHTVSDGAEMVRMVAVLRPDAVISDFRMPGKNGIDAAREILQQNMCGAVVLLTTYDDVQLVRQALAAGMRGYVLKVDAGEELIPAVRSVLRGETYVSRGIPPSWRL